jgi:hypothetical protein
MKKTRLRKTKKITLTQYGKIMEKIIARNNRKKIGISETLIDLLDEASKYEITESK